MSCDEPPAEIGNAWVLHGGDCNDDHADVFPGQTTFFPRGYTTAGGGESFDYDCSGDEDGDPSQHGPAPDCGVTIINCPNTQGFIPLARAGNPLCGSTKVRSCEASVPVCKESVVEVAPKRCR